MSYYSQTQANPIDINSVTSTNPIDNNQVGFSFSYHSINTIEVNIPQRQSLDRYDEGTGLEERELDPEVDKTLTDNNFRSLSSL